MRPTTNAVDFAKMSWNNEGKNSMKISDGEKPEYKCFSCGKIHRTSETTLVQKCKYTKDRVRVCDNECFKWRYYPPYHNPNRYDTKDKLFMGSN